MKNSGFSLSETHFFKVQVVQVGIKIRAKIDQKMRSRWEGLLASIFNGFWWILGAKLGPSRRQVGLRNRWQINPKRLGRLHIALGTYQEPPEREFLIFHWFWEVWGGESKGVPSWRADCATP